MSKTLKILIPLNSKGIKKEHLDEKAGFIDAYTADINSPYLDNHIFLLYKHSLETTEEIKRASYLAGLGYKPKLLKIDGKLYSSYSICITNNASITYKRINYATALTKDDYLTLMKFWDTSDSDINDLILSKKLENFKFETNIIPEAELEFDLSDVNYITINNDDK